MPGLSLPKQDPLDLFQLIEHAASTNAGITIYPPGGAPGKSRHISYYDFLQQAKSNAHLIQKIQGINADTVVLLHFDTHSDNFSWFWAVTLAGYLPAISSPLVNNLDQRRKHLTHLHTVLKAPIILTSAKLVPEFLAIEGLRVQSVELLARTNGCATTNKNDLHDESLRNDFRETDDCFSAFHTSDPDYGCVTGIDSAMFDKYDNEDFAHTMNGHRNYEAMRLGNSDGNHDCIQLSERHPNGDPSQISAKTNGHSSGILNPSTGSRHDLAVLMLTSGSSGDAKAVCLRHDQIIMSIMGKISALGHDLNAVFLNWIGMDHVANLLEIHLHAMYLGVDQVHVHASDLLIAPLTFLHLIERHRVSYTFAPNFFLASLKSALSDLSSSHGSVSTMFDLSCLRILMCGGEASVVKTLVELTDQLHALGVEGEFIRPAFGMTETCAASIYRENCPSYDVANNLEFASVGSSIPGMKLRIVKEDTTSTHNQEAEVGEVGHLQLTGPVVFREYFNNPKATKDSFTTDGWFKTGDKAYVDLQGHLNLTGRSKETIIINGVKYFPHELEVALEESLILGMAPSYTVVFPHRPTGSQTEELCVAYLPTFDTKDGKRLGETADAISHISMMMASVRPHRIIPLPRSLLPKSALGKISRVKIRAAFENGQYREIEEETNEMIKAHRVLKQETPTTEMEEKILVVFCEMFDLPRSLVWVGSSLYDLGISSIELIGFKVRVQNKLALGLDIPIVMLMQNPTIRGMADAITLLAKGPRPYDPVVPLHTKGSKIPLWLVHPGTGEIITYVALVRYITDRPLYALRARGFEKGEEYWDTVSNAVDCYYGHIKKTQPSGPYALAGYSQGSVFAYEIAKLLEANGDKVVFCGTLDTPPGIRRLPLANSSPIDMLLHVAYLLELTTREHALSLAPLLSTYSKEDAIRYVFTLGSQSRRDELDLDEASLVQWVEMVTALWRVVKDYQSEGSIDSMDVFYVESPLVEDQHVWLEEYLGQWKDHVKTPVSWYQCNGKHHTMLTAAHIHSFQKKLRDALNARGI